MSQTKQKKGLMCADHPQAVAVARCVACNRHVCTSCRAEIAHHPYCLVCARELVEESVNLAVVKGEAAHERRRFPRVSTVIPMRYAAANMAMADGILVNINLGGAGVVTNQRLQEESQWLMSAILPSQKSELTIQIGVMHTKSMGSSFYYSGVIFMNVGEAVRSTMEDFLRQRTAKQFVKLDKVSFV